MFTTPYPKSITFRPWLETSEAISKVLAAHGDKLPALKLSDICNMALVEYAKTLPDPLPIPLDPPKETAPEKA